MKSFSRLNTATSVERTSRPMSSYNFHSRGVPYVISTHRSMDNQRLYTIQHHSSSKGMGAQMEKEELYEQTMHLKKRNNKLKSELDEARSIIVKKDIEIRKKDKLIEDLSKENVQIVHEENVHKAKDSTLVTLVKRKYYQLKAEYDDVVKENELLKANVKLTKIKEIKLEMEVLQQEYTKLKQLYTHMQEQNKCNVNEISQLKTYQHEYLKQHQLICTLRDNYEHTKDECKRANAEIHKLKEKLSNKETINKKLILQQQKLQSMYDKLLNEKKQRERNLLSQYDYQKKLAEAHRMISIYKQETAQSQTRNVNAVTPQHIINNNNNNSNYMLTRLQEDITTKDNQLQTYYDLISDMNIKVSIYEKYITTKGDKPSKVLKDNDYNGTINSKTTTKLKQDLTRSMNNSNKNSSNNPTISHPSQQSTEHYKIPTNDIDREYFNDSKNAFKLFKIIFEANNITSDYLNNELNDIYNRFDNRELHREEFLKPFIDLFITCSQTTEQNEHQFIADILNAYLTANKDDPTTFCESLQMFYNKVLDYSTIENENKLIPQLEKEFNYYKNDLLKYLKENTSKDNQSCIEYKMFDNIIKNKIGLKINDTLYDYTLYKMRSTLPKGSSLFLLDTQFVIALLNGKAAELLLQKHSNKTSSINNEVDINKQTHITEENERESSSYVSDVNKARINDDSKEHNNNNNIEERFNVEINKSELVIENLRILTIMKNNVVEFDAFFNEDIHNDDETNMKVIHKDKFFQRLNTLDVDVDVTTKEMNDFINTYHITTSKSMLNVNQIKEDLNNISTH